MPPQDIKSKINLMYYKEIINPMLEVQIYLSFLGSLKNKINKTRLWTRPKTPWEDRICNIRNNKQVEDEK